MFILRAVLQRVTNEQMIELLTVHIKHIGVSFLNGYSDNLVNIMEHVRKRLHRLYIRELIEVARHNDSCVAIELLQVPHERSDGRGLRLSVIDRAIDGRSCVAVEG